MRRRKGPKPRPPWQKRVIAEKRELDRKIEALEKMIYFSPKWDSIPSEEQDRLRIQRSAMWTYSQTLAARIAAFPK